MNLELEVMAKRFKVNTSISEINFYLTLLCFHICLLFIFFFFFCVAFYKLLSIKIMRANKTGVRNQEIFNLPLLIINLNLQKLAYCSSA